MACNHRWEITLYAPSPGSKKDVPQLRRCEKCGKRQYKVWKYDVIRGQYQTYWRSG